jgi:hypothetical protein
MLRASRTEDDIRMLPRRLSVQQRWRIVYQNHVRTGGVNLHSLRDNISGRLIYSLQHAKEATALCTNVVNRLNTFL